MVGVRISIRVRVEVRVTVGVRVRQHLGAKALVHAGCRSPRV